MAAKSDFSRNLPDPRVLAERAVTDYGTTARNCGRLPSTWRNRLSYGCTHADI